MYKTPWNDPILINPHLNVYVYLSSHLAELFCPLLCIVVASGGNDGEAGQDLLLLIKLIINSPRSRASPTLKIHYCNFFCGRENKLFCLTFSNYYILTTIFYCISISLRWETTLLRRRVHEQRTSLLMASIRLCFILALLRLALHLTIDPFIIGYNLN